MDPHRPPDSTQATCKTGSSLIKFQLRPGADIPEEWLLPRGETEQLTGGEGENGMLPYYPAAVFPRPWIDGRRPVMLCLGGAPGEERPRPHRILKIGSLGKGGWEEKDEVLQLYLLDNSDKIR